VLPVVLPVVVVIVGDHVTAARLMEA
jgi:hypothetical protein